MRIAFFDAFSGISGDMTLGALVHAGMPFDALVAGLKKLGVPGFELEAKHIARNGIDAVKLDVVITDQPKYHRHLKDIEAIIDGGSFTQNVKTTAKMIFREIAVAEAKVHGSTLEKVHFHEVGAIDSIVDIVGTAICFDHLGIERVYSSAIRTGSGGTVKTQHGIMPIPAPATLEILKGYPTVLTDIPLELTTPTGAAIIKAMSSGVITLERMRVESVGYGAGTKEIPQVPNLLRVFIGELEPALDQDEIVSVETNIDDMNPEIIPYVIERLLAVGAHDAYTIPILMKKGRPGMLLSILTERRMLDPVLEVVFRETTTLGVRIQPTERRKVRRESRTVKTSFGPTRVKAVIYDGSERLIPEHDECRRIAIERNLPLKEVYRMLERELAG